MMRNVRFRIDLSPQCSIGPGKIELLETIVETGSLRTAARRCGMSYRHAWLLLDSLNRSFAEATTQANVGGRGGGGVTLTPFGAELVRRYHTLERRIERLARAEFAAIAGKVLDRSSAAEAPVRRKRLAKLCRAPRKLSA